MADTASTSLRLRLQETGANVNTWGTLLNLVLDLVDDAVAGMVTIPLTGNYSLTSTNYVVDEARNAILKFTGSTTSTVTVPGVPKVYLVWNATSAVVTMTTGSGATVPIDASDIVLVFCDGTNVKTLGYSGLSLKDYIAAAALGATGSLPAQTGNAGKYVKTDGTNASWQQPASTDLSDYATRILGVQVALAVAL